MSDDAEDPVLPSLPPAVPAVPSPAPAAPVPPGAATAATDAERADQPGGSPPEPLIADRSATRNVPTAQGGVATSHYGLPTATNKPSEPFVRPELAPMADATTALLVGRLLMVIAALLVGIAARRSTGAGGAARADAFWPVAISAGVLVAVGVVALMFWSATVADNAQRLSARCATPRGMVVAWAVPVAWVAVSGLTYLRVEVDGELDPLPGVAALGWLIVLAIAYGKLQGIFRALSRTPPLVWATAFPLDVLSFGVVWWRLTSWPSPVGGENDHVALTANLAFGAAGVLTVNALVYVWLAQKASAGAYERLGRIEARHRGDADGQPEWFRAGLSAPAVSSVTAADARPLIGTRRLSGALAGFHVAWGVMVGVFALLLMKLAFDYRSESIFLGDELSLADDDATAVGVVVVLLGLVYLVTIILHAVWSVLVATNGRRVTVHSPNPATFAIAFTPMPILATAGLLIGGSVGYWLVFAGLSLAFGALFLVNRMLMALSARLGGKLRGFGKWTLALTLVYVAGVLQNFLFAQTVATVGLYATLTLVQGVLIGAGGVIGFRAMRDLETTIAAHKRTRRVEVS